MSNSGNMNNLSQLAYPMLDYQIFINVSWVATFLIKTSFIVNDNRPLNSNEASIIRFKIKVRRNPQIH
jgi:hypothetical protein